MLRTRLAGYAAIAAGIAFTAPSTADASEVCMLTSIETRTAPRKPNIFEMILDCGAKTSDAQARAKALVNNAQNTAEAIEILVNMGYEVEGTAWRDSFTGRQVIGMITLVAEGEVAVDKDADMMPEAEATEGDEPKSTPAPEAEPEPFDDAEPEDIDFNDE